jgi:hypothetical protein
MANATRSSCSQLGPLGLCFCSDDLSPSQVAVVLVAATVGVLTVLSTLYGVVRVLLSLFVIPGKSVFPLPPLPSSLLSLSLSTQNDTTDPVS